MKKFVSLLVLVLMCSASLYAQPDIKKSIFKQEQHCMSTFDYYRYKNAYYNHMQYIPNAGFVHAESPNK